MKWSMHTLRCFDRWWSDQYSFCVHVTGDEMISAHFVLLWQVMTWSGPTFHFLLIGRWWSGFPDGESGQCQVVSQGLAVFCWQLPVGRRSVTSSVCSCSVVVTVMVFLPLLLFLTTPPPPPPPPTHTHFFFFLLLLLFFFFVLFVSLPPPPSLSASSVCVFYPVSKRSYYLFLPSTSGTVTPEKSTMDGFP